jgi:ABC-type lipoprotein release transport system permease subunit
MSVARPAPAKNGGEHGNGIRARIGRLRILVRLAIRNLVREGKRSLLTASAMVVGLGLLILSRSLADGAHEDWIDTGVRLGSGHVALQAPEYLESRQFRHRLDPTRVDAASRALEDPLLAPHVRAVAPRLAVQGLAASAASALPVMVEGVDPEVESEFSLLPERLDEGRYLAPDDRQDAYVSRSLATRLNIRVGSRFVVTAQGADGEIEGQLLRVVGIFRFGVQELEEGVIQIPIETARSWLAAPGQATTIAVLLGSSREVPPVLEQLDSVLGDSGIRGLSWREASPELDSAVRMDDYGDYLFHAILLAIVALAILNAILMSVLNRRREFAVLRALGLEGRNTGALVYVEGLLLTLVSGMVGIAVGLAVTWFFFRDGLDLTALMDGEMTFSGIVMDPVMVPEFRVAQIVQSLLFTLAIGATASLYPAVHAARLEVAESLKFET